MKIKRNVVLIGMPAVGKSTVGVLLAKRIGYDFLDTDILIQTREEKSLAQIIAGHGLDAFLEIEKKHLMSVNCTGHVIATGGSVVYKADAMDHLAASGTIVYLSIDLPTLLTRLSNMTERGVAIAPGRDIGDLYKERTPLYDTYADLTVECNTMNPEQVTAEIMQYLP